MKLCIGRVARAHGLRGEIQISLFRPRRGRSRRAVPAEGRVALARETSERSVTLEKVRFLDDRTVVVAVRGIDDRTEAETMEGALVYADSEATPPALADEADRCVGAIVVDAADESVLGTVSRIDDNGAQPILIVGDTREREIAIPFVAALVEVSPSAEPTKIRVHLPEGLVELNRG